MNKYGPEVLEEAGVPQFVTLIHELTVYLAALTFELCAAREYDAGVVSRAKTNLYKELSVEEVAAVQLAILSQCAREAERLDHADDSLQN